MNLGYLVHKMGSVSFHSGTTVNSIINTVCFLDVELSLNPMFVDGL